MEEKHYSIYSKSITIKSDSGKILNRIDSVINFFAAKKDVEKPKISLTLSSSKKILGKKADVVLEGKPLFMFDRLCCYRKGKNYFYSDGKSLVFSQPEKGTSKGYISEETINSGRFFSHIFFYIILVEMLRYNGLYYIHSSGVEKNSTSILIPGNGGVGKTTISLALVRKGFCYLSDDAILLQKFKKKVIAHPIPGDFHIDPSISQNFKELSEVKHALKYGKGPKRSFDPAIFYPDSFILKSKPNVIIFPQIVREAESRLIPLSSAQCLAKMIPNSLLVMIDKKVAGEHLDVLTTLSKQCHAFQLLSGKDLILNPDKVIEKILCNIEEK